MFISYIEIYPRENCCPNVLNGITVSLDGSDLGPVLDEGSKRVVRGVSQYGTIVKIVGGAASLQMAEVKIYGTYLDIHCYLFSGS